METTPNIFEGFTESRLESNQDSGAKGTVPTRLTFVEEVPIRPLHNGRKPSYTLQAERPEHRGIVMMKASGMTHREIAAAIGWTEAAISYVVKQPWAVEQILREIENAGREPVLQLYRITAMEACEKQIDLMRNAESEKVQSENAEKIIDRVFGKASQKIEVTNKPATEFSDDELANIAAQGKRN